MKKLVAVLIMTGMVLMTLLAGEVSRINWEDLTNPINFDDPFEDLSPEVIDDLSIIARVSGMKAEGRTVTEGLLKEEVESATRLAEQQIDVEGLMAERQRVMEMRLANSRSVNPDVLNRKIKLPGFALPLEMVDQKVTEFLLVPWFGACIHTPPPPANQIIHVRMAGGIRFDQPFTPVWIEGELEVSSAAPELYLVDGSDSIDTGYMMNSAVVTLYQ